MNAPASPQGDPLVTELLTIAVALNENPMRAYTTWERDAQRMADLIEQLASGWSDAQVAGDVAVVVREVWPQKPYRPGPPLRRVRTLTIQPGASIERDGEWQIESVAVTAVCGLHGCDCHLPGGAS